MTGGGGHWPHPIVLAWREVFGRRHPNAVSRRSHRRDVRHAIGHLRAWLRTDRQRQALKERHARRVL